MKKANVEEIEAEEVREFPNFVKRVLKPGGYCLLFIPIIMFQEWYESFANASFSVMPSLYTIYYDEKTVPKRTVNEFPQIMTDFVLIAKALGPHPEGFQPKFDTKFNLINCSSTRRRCVVNNVPFVKHKLMKKNSNSPFRTSEKPIGLLSEIIDLFTPFGGSEIDPFAGTLTTAISALRTNRHCVVVEKDLDCFEAALDRLFVIANIQRERSIKAMAPTQLEDDIILLATKKGKTNRQFKYDIEEFEDKADESKSCNLEDKDDSKEGAFAPASDLSLETHT